MIKLLNKNDLSILNKRTLKYNLAEAEKDYLLAVVSKIIFESPLKSKLVFKGGTAIHHCYLTQSRFSEDLDFTSLDKNITLEEVKEILSAQDFLEVKKEYVSNSTIKIERLKYAGPLLAENSLKVEIDFIQNVVLPPKRLKYNNAWKVDTDVNVMDIREICAEKIRATNERARYRDFYDLFLLFEEFKFDVNEINELISRKEIRKPMSKESIILNWEIAKKELAAESVAIYYEHDVVDYQIKALVNSIKL